MLLSCEYVWTVIPTELQSAETRPQSRVLRLYRLGLKTRIDLPCTNALTPTPVDATPKGKSDKIRYAARATKALEQHQPHVLGAHLGALPVVEVVLEVPVADAKFQVLEEEVVLHDVQGIKNVHVYVPRAN